MGNVVDPNGYKFYTQKCSGRKRIYTDETEITRENVVAVVEKTMRTHMANVARINYLVAYEQGNQPILDTPVDQDEIKNLVVVNVAASVTDFKVSYSLSSPISYVRRGTDNGNTESADDNRVGILNEMCYEQDKVTKDQELSRKYMITGLSYRAIFPRTNDDNALSPFEIINLDPACTYIIYSNDIWKRKMASVTFYTDEDGVRHYAVHTPTSVFEFIDGSYYVKETENGIGRIPVVCYETIDRMGKFEKAIPLLDGINKGESDRSTSLSRFIDAILWMNNVDIDSEEFDELRDKRAIKTGSQEGRQPSIKYVTAELNQTGAQALIDDMYDRALVICKVPGREQSSGGNTGQAVIFGASGWAEAESDANTDANQFNRPERECIDLMLTIAEKVLGSKNPLAGLKSTDIDVRFCRNRTANLISKSQVLLNQLQAGVHPRIAIKQCDMYGDPEQVYLDSEPYMRKWMEDRQTEANNNKTTDEALEQDIINQATVQVPD